MPGTFTGASEGVVVFMGNGDGTFQPAIVSPAPGSLDLAQSGDINGDYSHVVGYAAILIS